MTLLSYLQTELLFTARKDGQNCLQISLDLGKTLSEVGLEEKIVSFPDGQYLAWDDLAGIRTDTVCCYRVEGNKPVAVREFSEDTGRLYSLMPTSGAPTMLISGIPMHRFKGTDPHRDTLSKIKAAAPVAGNVLDTATGLGYTAIEAARTADRVTTIEIEPVVLNICRQNPWSQELFSNPRITQVVGDAYEELEKFADNLFSLVIHDPPVFSLAGDLYSGSFYEQVYRVLKRKGRMFHYIGDPESKMGAGVTKGVSRRLLEAGFARVERRPQAFGVMAFK